MSPDAPSSSPTPTERRRLLDRRGAGREWTPGLARVVDRNIQALIERRQAEESRKSREDRIAAGVSRFAGSMTFVCIHLAFFGGWILWNTGLLPVKAFDPQLVILAMFASVEAIFLSTFVLINQNRMQELADKRADLDLHISLLAEHEVTQLVALVTEIAKRMDIGIAEDPELTELAKDVAPEKVLDQMERFEGRMARGER